MSFTDAPRANKDDLVKIGLYLMRRYRDEVRHLVKLKNDRNQLVCSFIIFRELIYFVSEETLESKLIDKRVVVIHRNNLFVKRLTGAV